MATTTSRGASEPADAAGGLKRVALLIALAALAVIMLRDSLAYVVRPINPELALRIDPTNAEVAASRAEQMLRDNPATGPQAEALARRALRRSPVSAAGARMLATTRDLAGDSASARRLMAYSESLSRRDLPTQLWLIEDAVRHDDIARALHHYDIALRSSDATKALLFPVLINAIAQPSVAEALASTLAMRPSWANPFLAQAAGQARDLDGLARLLTALGRRGYRFPDTVGAQAASRMVDAGRYELAWQVYATGHPGARQNGLRAPDFGAAGAMQGPFAWTILGGNGLFAEPRVYGDHNALAYNAATGAGGVVARQLIMLPQGRFSLAGRVFERSSEGSPAQLRLVCASGQSIASVAAATTPFSAEFAVPPGCPAQWIELAVDGGENPLGTSGAVGDLRILDNGKARP